MPRKATTDYGEIIHFAGHRHLFPVRHKEDRGRIRLAGAADVSPDEVRIGWGEWFRTFIDRRLVFLYDESGGQPVTRAEAKDAASAPAAGPAGEASAPQA